MKGCNFRLHIRGGGSVFGLSTWEGPTIVGPVFALHTPLFNSMSCLWAIDSNEKIVNNRLRSRLFCDCISRAFHGVDASKASASYYLEALWFTHYLISATSKFGRILQSNKALNNCMMKTWPKLTKVTNLRLFPKFIFLSDSQNDFVGWEIITLFRLLLVLITRNEEAFFPFWS